MATTVESPGTRSPEAFSRLGRLAARSLWMLLVFLCLALIVDLLRLGGCGYLAFALAGSLVVHWHERRRVREMVWAIGFGAAYWIAYLVMGGAFHGYVGWWAGTAAGFAGLGSLQVLFVGGMATQGRQREEICATLKRAGLVPALCAASLLAVAFGVKIAPHTWDYTLYAFDRLLGVDTFVLGRAFLRMPALFNACAVVYNVLPLYICVTLMAAQAHGKWRTATTMAITLGTAGFLAYQICPATGPLYSFSGLFPWKLPSLTTLAAGPAATPDGLRNAMPSLHVGFALLCYWILSPMGRWLRAGALVYLAITSLATVGFGEHYFIDLVVAAPLALAVYGGWAEANLNQRLAVASAGALTTILWLAALRMGTTLWSREFGWTAVLATLVGTVVIKTWLDAQAASAQVRLCELTDSSS